MSNLPSAITSLKDPRITLVRDLGTRATRLEQGRCVLDSVSLIEQALATGVKMDFVICEPSLAIQLAADLTEAGVPVASAGATMLKQALRTQRPVAAIAVAHLAKENDDRLAYGNFVLVLDRVLDPGNLGTIVRTANGLGVTDIICTDMDTDLTSRKVIDSSRASVLRSRLRRFPTVWGALKELQERGFQIITTGLNGVAMDKAAVDRRPIALVVGNETDGVSETSIELSDRVVKIPMSNDVESLNVAVATGICLYELGRYVG
jgi:TrmH family RNA methyltransferase